MFLGSCGVKAGQKSRFALLILSSQTPTNYFWQEQIIFVSTLEREGDSKWIKIKQ